MNYIASLNNFLSKCTIPASMNRPRHDLTVMTSPSLYNDKEERRKWKTPKIATSVTKSSEVVFSSNSGQNKRVFSLRFVSQGC